MLIRKEHINNGAILGVWEINESKEELLALYPNKLRAEALKYVTTTLKSEKRSTEWLSVRLMLYMILDDEKIIAHNSDGRPYLKDDSYNISISHTKKHAAILLHKTKKVGIDIEVTSDRVYKVAKKFISDNEYIHEENKRIHLLLHWSAKETMFKLMKETEIDFKLHLNLEKFIPQDKGIIHARETKTNKQTLFDIHYEVYPEYVLTWSML